MKTLVINGSPRKNGDSIALVNEITKHLEGEIFSFNAYYDDISACTDCRYCWEHAACSIDDDMQKIYKLLNEVDNVILSSPVHFSELSGELLCAASRLQIYYAQRCIRKIEDFSLKKKNAILVLSGGGDGNPKPAIERAKIIFKQINAEPVGTVMSLGTNEIPAGEDSAAMKQAAELALKLNGTYREKLGDVR